MLESTVPARLSAQQEQSDKERPRPRIILVDGHIVPFVAVRKPKGRGRLLRALAKRAAEREELRRFERAVAELRKPNGISNAAMQIRQRLCATARLLNCLAADMPVTPTVTGLAHLLDDCAVQLARIALASQKKNGGR